MRIAVAGDDARFDAFADLAAKKGLEIVDLPKADICVCGRDVDFWGMKYWFGKGKCPNGYIDMAGENMYAEKIADFSAEGAISYAMNALNESISGMKIGVVGYGKIGKALFHKLTGLGAVVTVYSRRGLSGSNFRMMSEGFKGERLVFTTSPDVNLKADMFDRDALVFDLSSAPYSFDLNEFLNAGIDARREGGIPARYCPKSVAREMWNALVRGGAVREI